MNIFANFDGGILNFMVNNKTILTKKQKLIGCHFEHVIFKENDIVARSSRKNQAVQWLNVL